MQNNNQKPIVGAIVLAGVLIAGAILLKGSSAPSAVNVPALNTGTPATTVSNIAPINAQDRTLGNPNAKVTLVMYEDFQCPFCGAVNGLEVNSSLVKSLQQNDPSWAPFMPEIRKDIASGNVRYVYRDYAFLGAESIRSAEAARCAGDQGQFWEYHDYLYGHQKGENQGNFADINLKLFAKTIGLNTTVFDQCLDTSKYAQIVASSKAEGDSAGVSGTPKGFILKNGKVVSTINGAEGLTQVKAKIDAALK